MKMTTRFNTQNGKKEKNPHPLSPQNFPTHSDELNLAIHLAGKRHRNTLKRAEEEEIERARQNLKVWGGNSNPNKQEVRMDTKCQRRRRKNAHLDKALPPLN